MRLIDGDSLKRNLERLWDMHDDYDFANKDVWQEIENAPVIEPEQKWIPCSERLPYRVEHRDDMVLVCYGNGSIRFDSCMNGEWVHGNPIAWMPLPEPWRGE